MSDIEYCEILKKDQLNYVMSILGKCTENYVYMYDLDNDFYRISENALNTFDMPSCMFYNASEVLSSLAYPADVDMLNKDLEELKSGAKKEHSLQYRWVDKNGKFVWIHCAGLVIDNLEDSEGGHVLIGRIAKIGNKNTADNITGLFAESKLKQDIENNKAREDIEGGTVLRIGVDNFKGINERYGRSTGDDVLKTVADCIRAVCKEHKYYKILGDEFIILLKGEDGIMAKAIYQKIRTTMEEKIRETGYRVVYSISGGIVAFNYDDIDYEKVLHYSSFALNNAKLNGKNRTYLFKHEDYNNHLYKMDIRGVLRKAINNDFEGFILHYQPLVDANTNKVIGAEALLRFNSEKTGFLSPTLIVPILEESGLIIPVGKWIFTTAMKQAVEWQKYIPDFKMSINLSYVQIRRSDVVGDIMAAIKEIGIRPETLQFEFTESGLIDIDASMERLMRIFGENGINMALDDFGTGYSSLSYLQELKVNVIKLDRSFVASSTESEKNFKLIKHICEMSQDIGMQICLEGIETDQELKRLSVLHPEYVQGYLYGKPIETMLFSSRYLTKETA